MGLDSEEMLDMNLGWINQIEAEDFLGNFFNYTMTNQNWEAQKASVCSYGLRPQGFLLISAT